MEDALRDLAGYQKDYQDATFGELEALRSAIALDDNTGLIPEIGQAAETMLDALQANTKEALVGTDGSGGVHGI